MENAKGLRLQVEVHMQNNEFQYTKLSGSRWVVTRKGGLPDGYKAFLYQSSSDTINAMNDFQSKKSAIDWVSRGCPIDDVELSIGVTAIVWATNLKQAYEISKLQGAYLSIDAV